MRLLVCALGLAIAGIPPTAARAWGYEGHKVIATIAGGYLKPSAAAKIDRLLAADTDPLTPHDLASAATWADAWRNGHRQTSEWHFADIELDHPDLAAACFGDPPASRPASAGPEKACVVDRVNAFAAELADPSTPPAERIMALKFLLHFVGDLHQPLHASDNHDKGGNCVPLALGGSRTVNLHSYWDTGLVEQLDPDPTVLAARLRARITPALKARWERGDPRTWAVESYGVARTATYSLRSAPGCETGRAPIALPPGYDARARDAVGLQLQRAGVRLAWLLNWALADER